jgi:hypothetical protein
MMLQLHRPNLGKINASDWQASEPLDSNKEANKEVAV